MNIANEIIFKIVKLHKIKTVPSFVLDVEQVAALD